MTYLDAIKRHCEALHIPLSDEQAADLYQKSPGAWFGMLVYGEPIAEQKIYEWLQ